MLQIQSVLASLLFISQPLLSKAYFAFLEEKYAIGISKLSIYELCF
jgi:hypothetical protein